MMTISESNYSSNKMSTIRTINDKVVHQDNFNDVQQSSSTNSALITKRGFKPSDMFDPQKKEFLTSLSYKLFPVSWVSRSISFSYAGLTKTMQLTTFEKPSSATILYNLRCSVLCSSSVLVICMHQVLDCSII